MKFHNRRLSSISVSSKLHKQLILSAAFFLFGFCYPFSQHVIGESEVRIRLKNDGFVAGKLVNSTLDDHIAIDCPDFMHPLQLNVQSIRSVDQLEHFDATETGEQIFVLNDGMTIAGRLTQLDDKLATVESPSLGTVTFSRALLREFSDVNFAGRLVYSGPRSGQAWNIAEKSEDWTFEAGAIASSKANASIVGDVNLPDKSEVRISLSWTRSPDFVLAIGCNADAKSESAALKLEVWDGELAMVREVGNSVDLALIPNFSPQSNRLNLTVYLDQVNGVAAVCTPLGRVLEKLELKSDKVVPARFIKLSNHSQENYSSVLRLERLEVRQWDGHLPDGKEYSAGELVTASGEVIEGKLGVLDVETSEVSVLSEEKQIAKIKLNEVRRVLLSPLSIPIDHKDQDSQSNESLIEIELLDRSRLIGKWKAVETGRIGFQVDGFDELFTFDADQIISMYGSLQPYKPDSLPNTRGRLTAEKADLFGCLATDDKPMDTLLWLPEAASAPAQLSVGSSGRVAFSMKTTKSSSQITSSSVNRIPLVPFIARPLPLIAQRPANVRPSLPRKFTIGLEFRTGDIIEGKVTKIDESGVTFASSNTQTTQVVHAQMESVTLRPHQNVRHESPEKLERLMTVPRSMKADPPTHLLVSTSGDYLRGRLIRLDEATTTMEIRLEIIELPTEQISQIYWLHDRQWESKSQETEASEPTLQEKNSLVSIDGDEALFKVHAIRGDSRGITFAPTKLLDGKIYGKSDLLGDCEIPLDDLQLLLFGRNVGSLARELKKELWTLSLATLPKVYQDDGGETLSPLVGNPAPDFTLESLEGKPHQLSKFVGRVVVLDFWASWCGPCMKTMPEVERVVAEIGDDQVDLIAVNLQESKEKAAGAMERLGMSANVLLDIDGEVAQQYQANAIPQTVIIDRAGNVTQVFVGGGNKFIQEFSEALKAAMEGM